MNFGGHLLTGWALSQAGEFNRNEQRVIALMAIAPDIDGLAILLPGTFEEWHRTFGHNVFFGLAVPLLSLFIASPGRRVFLLTFSYLAMLSHFLLDLFVTGWWALYPLWPVSDWMILMSLYIPEPIMKYHIQITLFVLLVALTVFLYRRNGRSPFSLISERFDDFMITFITYPFLHRCAHCSARAFYKGAEDGMPMCGRCYRSEPDRRMEA